MDILLVNASVKTRSRHSRLSPPLGLAYIGAGLLQHGYNVTAVDCNLTDFKGDIDLRIAVHLEDDSRLYERAKARQCRLQPIRTDYEIWQDERSRFVCDRISADACVCASYRDLDTGQDRSALISNGTADLRCCLCPNAGTCNGRHQKAQ